MHKETIDLTNSQFTFPDYLEIMRLNKPYPSLLVWIYRRRVAGAIAFGKQPIHFSHIARLSGLFALVKSIRRDCG